MNQSILSTCAGPVAASASLPALFLVLGMHRSGTSALTGLLYKLGAELGDNLMPPTRDNPKGYFENQDVVTAHETLLAALGCSWQSPRPLPEGWRTTAAADDAHETLSELLRAIASKADIVAVKDPRACRFATLWVDIARAARTELGVVLMVRHPTEVAASLHKRDGLSYARAHLLWIVYLLDAERQTRGVSRAFVSYEALLADWRGTLASMRATGLGDMLPEPAAGVDEEIDVFLDVSLRRHEATAGVSETSPFESLAVELYGLSLRCASGEAYDIEAQFDDVLERLKPLAARYLEAPLQLEQAIERQRSDQAQLNATMQLAALRELWRPALPSSAPGAARLYYRSEGVDFGEENAVSAYPEVSGARRVVIFELSAQTDFDYLRFDPDSAPGVYAIESVSVDGEHVRSLTALIQGVNERPVPTMRANDVVRFAALGDDPHFVFDVRALVRAPGMTDARRVEVKYRFETVMSEVGGYLDDYRESLISSGRDLAEWQSQIGTAVRTLLEQQTQIDHALDTFPQIADRQLRIDLAVDALAGQIDASAHALAESLALVREQQELVSAWAQRRSLSYWWRRLKSLLM